VVESQDSNISGEASRYTPLRLASRDTGGQMATPWLGDEQRLAQGVSRLNGSMRGHRLIEGKALPDDRGKPPGGCFGEGC
jgi:hypothetical protein